MSYSLPDPKIEIRLSKREMEDLIKSAVRDKYPDGKLKVKRIEWNLIRESDYEQEIDSVTVLLE